jgi:hemolysin activation/secretion protein
MLYLGAAVNSEVERNTIVGLNARYYKNFSRHTISTRFRSNLGYELDSSRQFTLGADSGLRGYPARAFTGDKLALINLEDRQYWGNVSMGPEFALGTIVFVDAGNVWKRDEDIDLDKLNWSTGFGFRIGMTNLPRQPIVRIDLGWALTGEDNYELTMGAEQHF